MIIDDKYCNIIWDVAKTFQPLKISAFLGSFLVPRLSSFSYFFLTTKIISPTAGFPGSGKL